MRDKEIPGSLTALGVAFIFLGFAFLFAQALGSSSLLSRAPLYLFIIFGVGLLSLMNWARVSIIGSLILFIGYVLVGLVTGVMENLEKFKTDLAVSLILILVIIVPLLFLLSYCILYLNRSSIKELFVNHNNFLRINIFALVSFWSGFIGFLLLEVEIRGLMSLVTSLQLFFILVSAVAAIIYWKKYNTEEFNLRSNPLAITGAVLSGIIILGYLGYLIKIHT